MERFEAEELDSATLDYLRQARERHGLGLPGIFLDGKQARLWTNSLPIWAAICGPLLILFTLFLTWGSTHDPIGVALLMTAGFFLGGWLLVAAFRCLIAQSRSDYIGVFKYIDPLYIWHGTGTGVWVTPIDMLLDADLQDQHDEHGNYKHSTVRIRLADQKLDLEVKGRGKAAQLEEYLHALVETPDGTPAERGYAALEQVSEDEEDEEEVDQEPVVETIPRPERDRTSMGWMTLLVLPLVGIGLFFGCKWLATRQRDDAIFQIVKAKQVGDLRFYLIDRRNTRHRAEVVRLLGGIHDQAARRIETQGEPELTAGLADLVRAVAGEARPIITLGFAKQEKKPDSPAAYLSPAVLETLERQIITDIGARLATHIGQTMADYAEVRDGHAMIEFNPKVILPDLERGGPREVRIDWTVTLQADAEAKKRTVTISTKQSMTGNDPAPVVRKLYQELAGAFNKALTQRLQ